MELNDNPTPEEAAEFAAHKAKSAQAAVELSREVHQEELVRKIVERTEKVFAERMIAKKAAAEEDLIKAKSLVTKAEFVADTLLKGAQQGDDRITKSLAEALRDVFGEHSNSGRFIDTARIPLICQAMLGMEKRLGTIEGNIIWGVRIVVGAVIVAVLGLVITSS